MKTIEEKVEIPIATLPSLDDAKAALDRADSIELHRMYKTAVEKCNQIAKTLEMIVHHYAGDNKFPRYQESDSAIAAMEKVALSALELAKTISQK